MQTTNTIIKQTKAWLKQVVIGLQFCPFAEQPYSKNHIKYIVCDHSDNEKILLTLISSLTELDNNKEIETSLIILSDPQLTFDHYLDLLELANALMDEYDYSGTYQLASFHPDYQFEGTDSDDASNFTNRSPYPMLHCLRESSLDKALQNFPCPEDIPKKNIEKTSALGIEYMQHKLDTIINMTENNGKKDKQHV